MASNARWFVGFAFFTGFAWALGCGNDAKDPPSTADTSTETANDSETATVTDNSTDSGNPTESGNPTDSGNPTETEADTSDDLLNASVPWTLAVASNTAYRNPAGAPPPAPLPPPPQGGDDYASKVNRLRQALEGTTAQDCLAALPTDFGRMAPNVSCYGPSITYEEHPDYDPNCTGPGCPPASAMLPGGDLGLWTELESSTGEACTAAKLNSLVLGASVKSDLAIGAMAMTACAARISGLLPPEPGSSLDVTSVLTEVAQEAGFTIALATLSRGQDTPSGAPMYNSALSGTYTVNERSGPQPRSFSIALRHEPSDLDNTQFAGHLVFIGEEVFGRGNSSTRVVSLVYRQDAGGLNYKLETANFHPGATDPYVLEDGRLATFWGADFNLMIADISTDGAGKVAYAWQAGNGDGFTRNFNVETTAEGTGIGYFGFAPNPEKHGAVEIDRMICNWAGPNNNHSGVSEVQSQSLERDEGSGLWLPSESHILYAPTNSCDWDGTPEGSSFQGLQSPIAHDFIAVDDMSFEPPTAPAMPGT